MFDWPVQHGKKIEVQKAKLLDMYKNYIKSDSKLKPDKHQLQYNLEPVTWHQIAQCFSVQFYTILQQQNITKCMT